MGAKNKVVAGDYEGGDVFCFLDELKIISTSQYFDISLDKSTIKSYDIIDEESRKSAASAVGRAAAGAIILGPVGLIAGVTAKRKGIYTIALEYHDGGKSLIEIDEKRYKLLIKKLF